MTSIVGKNLNTHWSHVAAETIAVPLARSEDCLNILKLYPNPDKVVESIDIKIDVPDMQLGFIGING